MSEGPVKSGVKIPLVLGGVLVAFLLAVAAPSIFHEQVGLEAGRYFFKFAWISVLLALAVSLAMGLIGARLLKKTLTAPISQVAEVMSRLARGDLRVDVPYKERKGEIGRMARALEALKENALKRVEAEKALRENEIRFKNIVEQATDWFWEKGPDLRFSYLSENTPKALDGVAESFMGSTYFDLADPKDIKEEPDKWRRYRESLHAHEPFRNFTFPLQSADGAKRYIQVSGSPIFSEDGEFKGYRGVGSDVTEMKRRDEALKKSEAGLANAQRIANMGNWDWDIESGEFGWSKEVYRIFGLAADGFKPSYEGFIAKVHPDDRAKVEEAVGRALEGGETFNIDHRIVLSDGAERIVNEQAEVHFDGKGKPLFMSGTCQDITERKQVEAQLVQSSKLAMLGEMAAGITHELSQPLNIIRLTADGGLLKIEKGNYDTGESCEHLKIISGQTQRMADIMDHMRAFSRKDAGGLEPFDPVVAVSSAASLVEKQFHSEGIALTLDLPERAPWVLGRAVQLEQVVLNLLNNAHDAVIHRCGVLKSGGDFKGKISVKAKSNSERGFIEIRITDNGGGIPEEKMEKIFDPFFTTKEVGRGTGLGLSVSFGIITAMAGYINVSNTDDGACFRVWLPVKTGYVPGLPVPVPVGEEIEAGVFAFTARHVLVVDDEKAAAAAIATFLEEEGYRVSVAHDGREALRCHGASPADVIVTDIRMPKLDGLEMIKRLRDETPDLPVVVMTGQTDMSDRALPEGKACKVLKKPIRLMELAEVIDELVGGDTDSTA